MNRIWPYAIRVAGILHYIKPSDIVSDEIICERESDNQYDQNAIAVFMVVAGFRKKIGYLSKDIARQLSTETFPHPGIVVWKGDKGIRIEI